MEKKINIEALERKNPFSVPDGYFEGLASRVMSSITEEAEASASVSDATEKKKPNVVGLLPRKKKLGWVKWVAAAACVCGAVFFIASQQDGTDDTTASQMANVKSAPISTHSETETAVTTQETESPSVKVYANNAYDLSRHVRRSAVPAPANITPQPVVRTSTTVRTPSVQMASTKVPASSVKSPATTISPATPAQNAMLASNTTTPVPVSTSMSSQSETDAYAMEYDMLDYTNMSGTEIYDYLAGNEYY